MYGLAKLPLKDRASKNLVYMKTLVMPTQVGIKALLTPFKEDYGLGALEDEKMCIRDSDNVIPDDVADKILLFAKAAVAAASPRGRSYLSIGNVSMGIAGSYPNPDIFQEYFGMRSEQVDVYKRQEYGYRYNPIGSPFNFRFYIVCIIILF